MLSRTNVAGAAYKYATGALNTVPEMMTDWQRLVTGDSTGPDEASTMPTEEGKPFHATDAATGSARSLSVERFVGVTTNVSEMEERRRRRPLTLARYVSAVP